MYLAVFSLIVLTLFSLALPIIVRELIKVVEQNGGNGLPSSVWVISGVLLGIYVLRFIFRTMARWYNVHYAYETFTHLRVEMYKHLQTLSPRFYHDKQIGQIHSRVMDDIYKLDLILVEALPELFVGLLTFIGVTTVLFVINPLLALVALAPVPFVLITSFVQRKMRGGFKVARRVLGETSGTLSDNLQGMREIQVFGKQEYEATKFENLNNEVNRNIYYSWKWSSILKPVMELLQGIATILVIVVGTYFAMQGHANIADIVTFIMFIGILYSPLFSLARMSSKAAEALESVARVFEYMDTESDVQDRENAKDVGTLHGDIEFHNVTYGYNEQVVLDNFSFVAPAGSMIALVGETGAGKSTIASLIARFYDIEKGSITIDGIDIRDMTMQSLRSNLSIVLQDVFLFNGTISANIAYGSKESDTITHEQIVQSAKSAQIHDFIMSMPQGYDTMIGERGVRLSGGQKQRLAIARALLRNTPILILDEATSSIDNTTEKQIQTAIENISADRTKTIIVIAHRLSTILRADKILFIENGKILEQGTHEELTKKGGAYAKLSRA